MATDVLMPQMGESIAEGTITKWLKKVGDPVERDEPLYEISTDKVDAEIPSPATGKLAEIIVGEGETVEVKTVVARIAEEGEEVGAGEAEQAEPEQESSEGQETAKKDEDAARDAKAEESEQEAEPAGREDEAARAKEEEEEGASQAVKAEGRTDRAGKAAPAADREERIRTRSSPLVRKIAAEHGVDITEVDGTGVHGRVTKQDILDHVEQQKAGAPRRRKPEAVSVAAAEEEHAPEVPVGDDDRVEPMSRMRQIIAEHMVASVRTSPHVHTYYEIDMERVDQLRKANKDRFVERTGGAKLTYTVFMAKAVIDSLGEHPVVNASISGTDVVYHGSVHLGMAVALDWGLIVPVIRNAQDLSMVGLAKAITDKATRARERKLNPDEIKGSTFTITNPGSLGSLMGDPIINQPNVAILGMGKVEKRVVVVDDMIAIRPRMYVSMGYDHRLIDGATAERFLSSIKSKLESFDETAL